MFDDEWEIPEKAKGSVKDPDRNEVEHKGLIKTANEGIGAIRKLHDKYADVTRMKFNDGDDPRKLDELDFVIDSIEET